MTRNAVVLAVALSLVVLSAGAADVPIGLMRDPDISARHVVFTHADQLWIAPREGGRARKLTTLDAPHRFAKFDPAGERVAFVRGDAELLVYGDLYTVPVSGGEAARLTHHPAGEILNDWTAAGELLYFSNDASPLFRQHHLFTIDASGGIARRIDVPYGAWASLDSSGEWLAYVPHYADIGAHWKRYRGGNAADIWLVHLPSGRSRRITDWAGDDTMPMWRGRTVYYLSGAGANRRANLWAFDTDTSQRRQITDLDEFDVRAPAIGPGARGEGEIVFEHGPDLKTVSLADGRIRTLRITIDAKDAPAATRTADAASLIDYSVAIAPDGRTVAVSARGDIWVLGPDRAPRNLTSTGGAAEREPAWSPDGRTIAFFSDATGEYELTVVPADGSAPPRALTKLGPGFRTRTSWSPDGRRVAFIDQQDTLWVADATSGVTTRVGKDRFGFAPEFAWAPDSRRIAYTIRGENFLSRIVLHDLQTGTSEELTGGDYDDTTPLFSPDGQTVYFASTREFGNTTFGNPRLGDVQRLFVNAEPQVLLALSLRDRNLRRLALPRAGARWSFSSLAVNDRGQLVYSFFPLGQPASIRLFDPAAGKEEVLVEGSDSFAMAADGKTMVYRAKGAITLRAAAPGAAAAAVTASPMSVTIDMRKEWRQLFDDAWRLFRDFFYDANMHGVDWPLMRTRYLRMLEKSASRRDVSYVLNQMSNELNVSHAEASGGDYPAAVTVRISRVGASFDARNDTGVLGADFEADGDRVRLARIYRGDPTLNIIAPLDGSGVKEGDFLLAVEGQPIRAGRDPLAAFVGRAGKATRITVASPAEGSEAREVEIVPVAAEADLRYLDWIARMRRYVDERSGGRIGFISMPFTTILSQADFYRQFYGQLAKHALIIDSRWNGGGEGAMQVVESLARAATEYTVVRGSEPRPEPRLVHRGPKAMLISGMSGSGGDALAYEFRLARLGKLIGTRTWGGLVGNRGNPGLIDGGGLRIPSRGVYALTGQWLIEGTGVAPDIEVEADPAKFRGGSDPQLDRAIRELLAELESRPPVPPVPPPPDRSF